MANILALTLCLAGAISTGFMMVDNSHSKAMRYGATVLCALNIVGVAANVLCIMDYIK